MENIDFFYRSALINPWALAWVYGVPTIRYKYRSCAKYSFGVFSIDLIIVSDNINYTSFPRSALKFNRQYWEI